MMRRGILWIVGLTGCAAASVLGAPGEVTLAERGKADGMAIVRSEEASASQRHAAEELQRFTEQMTGVRLPIVTDREPLPARAVLLGVTRHTAAILGTAADAAAFGDDGFRIVTRPPHLLILGGPVRGTLYGVYELLERVGGCRWYASWHSVIPRLERFTVPNTDETQKPAFALREPFWFDMFDGDLAARNKANGNAMRLTERHGGKIRFGGGLFCHTFNRLCPPEEFFETHPEYFSEIDGRRIKEPSQLCLTNPDVLKIVTTRVLERIRKDPTAKLFSVSQNDWRYPCTCPACKAIDDREESHAGTLITFVNQVAEAVEREFPEVWIETLAYQYTRKPPKTVRPRRNVVPRLCTIECDFSYPLDQSAYEQNRKFVEDIRGWSAMTDKLYIWDYTTNFRHYTAPFPNVLALRDNVRFFRDHRVVGLFEQGAYHGRHGDFAELKAWLLAKWLWNPDLPTEPLLADFFAGYYGAAAPLVRQYFDELHTFYNDPAKKPLRIFDDVRSPVLPDAFLDRAADLWSRAEAAVRDSPAHAYNVRMGAFSVLYARLSRLPASEQKTVWVTSNPQQYAVPAEYRALATELLKRFDEARNIRLAESLERHTKTITDWRALISPPPLPPPGDRATIEDEQLSLGRPGVWGEKKVADPQAGDGFALKLFNTHYEWCTSLPFGKVAFDPGARYRIRIRLRVERVPGQEGTAFWAGVYDPVNKKGHGKTVEPKTSAIGDGYAWYDVAEWVPESAHYVWIGPGRFDKKTQNANPAIRAVYIDCLELQRLEK
ncbi:MAG TPA: DUF4838 domain-containing protein [Kiritimatiellia bacterium]|jgi:hypothetical protein|nr:DUF4838 domain-containing protein [Kiritimatiellia bacterium]HPW76264.1 DUF4838 domain-containing protein [Kiritimatiellia bacterium]